MPAVDVILRDQSHLVTASKSHLLRKRFLGYRAPVAEISADARREPDPR